MTAIAVPPVSDEPRFPGDMRWVWRWQDADGNSYGPGAPAFIAGAQKVRVLQVGVPSWAALYWADVPEVDET